MTVSEIMIIFIYFFYFCFVFFFFVSFTENIWMYLSNNFELNVLQSSELGKTCGWTVLKGACALDLQFNHRSAPQAGNLGQIQTHPKAVIVNLTTATL